MIQNKNRRSRGGKGRKKNFGQKGGKAGGVYDFWGEGANSGKQVSTGVAVHGNTITSKNKWGTKAGETVATDSRVIRFHATPHGRMLDYKISTIHFVFFLILVSKLLTKIYLLKSELPDQFTY